jgi:hypothetical protein
LFIFCQDLETVYFLLYVDDIVLTASSIELLQRTISALHLGQLHHFLASPYNNNPSGYSLVSDSA